MYPLPHSANNPAHQTLDFLHELKLSLEQKINQESERVSETPNRPDWQKELDNYTLEILYQIDSLLLYKTEEIKELLSL